MSNLPPYKIFALGDAAISVDFGNIINDTINDTVISLFKMLQQRPPEGMTEVVPAYSSLTIYYDVITLRKKIQEEQTVFDWMKNEVLQFLQQENKIYQNEKRLINVPVCYEKEFAPDLEWASAQVKISVKEIIQLHTSKTYRVYMLGFLPGFAYMGEVDDKIALPRKEKPLPVTSGSVGIAGKQTGVYPLNSPGGWQIIGRTPLTFFNKENDEPTPVKAGDSIQFISISKNEFENIKSRHS